MHLLVTVSKRRLMYVWLVYLSVHTHLSTFRLRRPRQKYTCMPAPHLSDTLHRCSTVAREEA